MPKGPNRRLLIGWLIVLLHLPLIAYALWLYPQIEQGQCTRELPFLKMLVALILAALLHVSLNRIAPGWNPERSRLGEYEP